MEARERQNNKLAFAFCLCYLSYVKKVIINRDTNRLKCSVLVLLSLKKCDLHLSCIVLKICN